MWSKEKSPNAVPGQEEVRYTSELPQGDRGSPHLQKRGMKANRNTKKSLECLLCRRRYSLNDIAKGNYQIETKICSPCYLIMQEAPREKSCFGKPGVLLPDGTKLYGYDPVVKECQELCPDRLVCRKLFRIIPNGVANAETQERQEEESAAIS